MKSQVPNPSGFWETVGLLLAAARQRAHGRRKRQGELLRHRSGRVTTDWDALGLVFTALAMIFVHGIAAFVIQSAVTSGERLDAEEKGKIVVSRYFLDVVNTSLPLSTFPPDQSDQAIAAPYYSSEARKTAGSEGAQQAAERRLRQAIRDHGARDFISADEAAPGISALPATGVAPMLGSVMLIFWVAMLAFQGEGLELDLQRRRHPMWEWLFTHPVMPGAVFLAEMLSPMAANPIYWSAPLCVGILYGFAYGHGLGFVAVVFIGIPISLAVGCLGKALEIGIILRCSPRSRGAMIGFMSWLGYASMMVFFFGLALLPQVVTTAARFLKIFSWLPWPWLRWFLGGDADGSFSFLSGMLHCWAAAGATIAGSIVFSVWGARQGLSGNPARAEAPTSPRRGRTQFGKDPLYRKEFLWFIRDRGAIVQTILVPMTVASYQLFHFRSFLSNVQGAWNYLCGTAILFGTYFLWVLGPKSLASEGSALWIPLTWPRGMESLLKAKAWLWSMISTGLVLMVLGYAAFLFPQNLWQIALVGIGWFFFARSMAEKTVTLVTVTSASGEPEKVPKGRYWAAQLGMLTFAIGVLTQQWPVAMAGIVYSYVTAAAMWENFRARLPYLYDPWAEKLPPPPTTMHAMVAISLLVEAGAALSSLMSMGAGAESIAVMQALSYGICAVFVCIGVSTFLRNRNVSLQDIWRWKTVADQEGEARPWWRPQGFFSISFLGLLVAGAVGGLLLGRLADGYMAFLQHFPTAAEMIRKSQEQMAKIPGMRTSFAVMAVGFAPWTEEYLFRGLLFRSLDREWGGWRAVAGSAAFFAIYHPPLAWPLVGLFGIASALLFKKTGRLEPSVVMHLVYNAFVLA